MVIHSSLLYIYFYVFVQEVFHVWCKKFHGVEALCVMVYSEYSPTSVYRLYNFIFEATEPLVNSMFISIFILDETIPIIKKIKL